MQVAKFLRDHLRACTYKGQPRFELVDAGDEHCLPVVGARLNPDLFFKYDDVDIQHAVAEFHWYVSAYALSFENYAADEKLEMLCGDIDHNATMFRIVVKSNLTLYLAQDLICKLDEVLPLLDQNASQKAGEHRAPSLRAMVYAAKAAGTLANNARDKKEHRASILHGLHATC